MQVCAGVGDGGAGDGAAGLRHEGAAADLGDPSGGAAGARMLYAVDETELVLQIARASTSLWLHRLTYVRPRGRQPGRPLRAS